MTILDAIILGLVEGITESLPVSSTGHLVLAASLLGLDGSKDIIRSTDAMLIVIQGGAILAVLGLYRHAVWSMCLGLIGRHAKGLRLARNILIAFLPAAILGPLLDDWIESRLMHPWPVLFALAAGGIIMILSDRRNAKTQRALSDNRPDSGADLSATAALTIGLLQCVAMWPGTSRLMVTVLGGMMVGLRPAKAAQFSFLLALPTLGGATVFKLTKNVLSDQPNMFEVLGWAPIVIGILAALISASLVIRWLVTYLTTHGLAVFGWYRIVLTAVLAVVLAQGWVHIAPEPSGDSSSDQLAEPKIDHEIGSKATVPSGDTVSCSILPLLGQTNARACGAPLASLNVDIGVAAAKGPPPVRWSQPSGVERTKLNRT